MSYFNFNVLLYHISFWLGLNFSNGQARKIILLFRLSLKEPISHRSQPSERQISTFCRHQRIPAKEFVPCPCQTLKKTKQTKQYIKRKKNQNKQKTKTNKQTPKKHKNKPHQKTPNKPKQKTQHRFFSSTCVPLSST